MSAPDDTYDIFISYAHADVLTDKGKELIKTIKQTIEKALQNSGTKPQTDKKEPQVFLDNDALKWGSEWNAVIRKSLCSSKVFVFLLSPNYLKSDYCQREKLWWAKQEIDCGRLNKGLRPIYFISLPNTGDPKVDEYIRELKICQASSTAFFDSNDLDEKEIDQAKLNEIAQRIQECLVSETDAEKSFSSIHPKISHCFVGRLNDLEKLNNLVFTSGRIPIITGLPGVGKSELAVAFASAYAECFPQGRFQIPMENVRTWPEAMNILVEWCKAKCEVKPKDLGLPDDFEMLSPEEKMRVTYEMLANRAKHGDLLLLLDNLQQNNLRLISKEGLTELNGTGLLPDKLHILGTTRIKERIQTAYDMTVQMDIVNLTEKDALEFFCRVSEDVFPFAKYPMENGELLLVDQAMGNNPPSKEERENINRDYAALKALIKLLDCHAFSLELFAGYIISKQRSFDKHPFREELKALQEDSAHSIYSGLTVHPHRTTKNKLKPAPNEVISAETLLNLTFEEIRDIDENVDGIDQIGEKILKLAQFASFFPPEQVPEEALVGIWKQEFGESEITFKDNIGRLLRGNAHDFAINELKQHRIINGEESLLKMHRITRDVLQDKMDKDGKLKIIRSMQAYLDHFLETSPDPLARELLPWCEWADKTLREFPVLRDDVDFLRMLLTLANKCMFVDLYGEVGKLEAYVVSKNISDKELEAKHLYIRGLFDYELKSLQSAEDLFKKSVELYSELSETATERILIDWALALDDLANLYSDLDRFKEAEEKYSEALTTLERVANKDSERYLSSLAAVLNNLANLHSEHSRNKEAEKGLLDALKLRCRLVRKNPKKYLGSLAVPLNNLAILHGLLDRDKEAERELRDVLTIRRELADKNPEKYRGDYATALISISNLHWLHNRYKEAERELQDALTIRRELADKIPEKYRNIYVRTLTYFAEKLRVLNRKEEAEQNLLIARDLSRKLAEEEHGLFRDNYAHTLISLSYLHSDRGSTKESEEEFNKAINIFRDLSEKAPEKYLSPYAHSLNELALFYHDMGRNEEAEEKSSEAMKIYRGLVEKAPEEYLSDFANALGRLAIIHDDLDRKTEAEKEYSEALFHLCTLVEKVPEKYLEDLADVLNNYATLFSKTGRKEEAEKGFAASLSLYCKLAEMVPEKYLNTLSVILDNLGIQHRELGLRKEAEVEQGKSAEIRRKYDEKDYSGALEICRGLVTDDPEESGFGIAHILYTLGIIARSSKEKEQYFLEALKRYRSLANDNHEKYDSKVAEILIALSGIHQVWGPFDLARKEEREAQLLLAGNSRRNKESDKNATPDGTGGAGADEQSPVAGKCSPPRKDTDDDAVPRDFSEWLNMLLERYSCQ